MLKTIDKVAPGEKANNLFFSNIFVGLTTHSALRRYKKLLLEHTLSKSVILCFAQYFLTCGEIFIKPISTILAASLELLSCLEIR